MALIDDAELEILKERERLEKWAERFVLVAAEWLHEINKHIFYEGNAPIPPDNSWLALEGCNHISCKDARAYKKMKGL